MVFTVTVQLDASDLDATADIVKGWRLSSGATIATITGQPEMRRGLPITVGDDGEVGSAWHDPAPSDPPIVEPHETTATP